MAEDSSKLRRWSDTELTGAVASSNSWRGLMRALGLPETSPATIQRIKQDITRLDLNTSHFTTQQAWSDDHLRQAVVKAQSWDELLPK